jgi:hypothetical protein
MAPSSTAFLSEEKRAAPYCIKEVMQYKKDQPGIVVHSLWSAPYRHTHHVEMMVVGPHLKACALR